MLFDWDAPANEVFGNLPPEVPFRVWVYQKSLVYGYDHLAKLISRTRAKYGLHPVTSSCLRRATKQLVKGYDLRTCPRCDRPTTSKHYCSICQQEQQVGTLSQRERDRIAQHYAMAQDQYSSKREAEHGYHEDEYTRS